MSWTVKQSLAGALMPNALSGHCQICSYYDFAACGHDARHYVQEVLFAGWIQICRNESLGPSLYDLTGVTDIPKNNLKNC